MKRKKYLTPDRKNVMLDPEKGRRGGDGDRDRGEESESGGSEI